MGLDSYIFKTTKQGAMAKKKEIFNARNKDRSQGIDCGGFTLFVSCFGDDGCSNYINNLHPDVYWRTHNHITAWISEKIFGNPKGNIQKYIGVLTKKDLLALRDDCRKVIEHCVLPNGELNIDEAYCEEIFPNLDMAFSGNRSYDQYFIEEITDSMNDIDRLLLSSKHPSVRFIFYADF
jgi:hypothetical protein